MIELARDLRSARRVGIGALLVALALALGACGDDKSSGEEILEKQREEAVKEEAEATVHVQNVVESFVSAGRERDFDAACALLTVEARATVGGDACPEVLSEAAGEGTVGGGFEIVAVRVSGNRAAVDVEVPNPETGVPTLEALELERTDSGDWRITSLGG